MDSLPHSAALPCEEMKRPFGTSQSSSFCRDVPKGLSSGSDANDAWSSGTVRTLRLSKTQRERHRRKLRAWHHGYRHGISCTMSSLGPPPGLDYEASTRERSSEDIEAAVAMLQPCCLRPREPASLEMSCSEFQTYLRVMRHSTRTRPSNTWSCTMVDVKAKRNIKVNTSRYGRLGRMKLGLEMDRHMKVRGVAGNSPAMRAGIRCGWFLRNIDGAAITSIDDLQRSLCTDTAAHRTFTFLEIIDRIVAFDGSMPQWSFAHKQRLMLMNGH